MTTRPTDDDIIQAQRDAILNEWYKRCRRRQIRRSARARKLRRGWR